MRLDIGDELTVVALLYAAIIHIQCSLSLRVYLSQLKAYYVAVRESFYKFYSIVKALINHFLKFRSN